MRQSMVTRLTVPEGDGHAAVILAIASYGWSLSGQADDGRDDVEGVVSTASGSDLCGCGRSFSPSLPAASLPARSLPARSLPARCLPARCLPACRVRGLPAVRAWARYVSRETAGR
jgi:hypothetical protein